MENFKKYKAVYDTIKAILYEKGARMHKKHGNWIVMYAPKSQVVFMDSWNGHIYQAHSTEPILDDSYGAHVPTAQAHTLVTDYERWGDSRITTDRLEQAVDVYKTLLPVL